MIGNAPVQRPKMGEGQSPIDNGRCLPLSGKSIPLIDFRENCGISPLHTPIQYIICHIFFSPGRFHSFARFDFLLIDLYSIDFSICAIEASSHARTAELNI